MMPEPRNSDEAVWRKTFDAAFGDVADNVQRRFI
jgi:hypothetical protein